MKQIEMIQYTTLSLTGKHVTLLNLTLLTHTPVRYTFCCNRYRAHDCRNNVRYSCAGSIVYTAAAVGVVYSKSAGRQKFFQGGHASDIIGMHEC